MSNKLFKNNQKAFAKDAWTGVQLFLDTWGDLPGEQGLQRRLMKLGKQDLAYLCELALDAACRIELSNRYIKIIQNKLNKLDVYKEDITIHE